MKTNENLRHGFVFDMDGTLYNFDGDKSIRFHQSSFSKKLRKNTEGLIREFEKCSDDVATVLYDEIKREHQIIRNGLVARYGMTSSDYFAATWNIDPTEFVTQDYELSKLFSMLENKVAVLTGAPRIWALRVLTHLDILQFVQVLTTCEEMDSKVNLSVWNTIAQSLHTELEKMMSVGDTYETDLAPAKAGGAITVLVGSEHPEAGHSIDSVAELPEILIAKGYVV